MDSEWSHCYRFTVTWIIQELPIVHICGFSLCFGSCSFLFAPIPRSHQHKNHASCTANTRWWSTASVLIGTSKQNARIQANTRGRSKASCTQWRLLWRTLSNKPQKEWISLTSFSMDARKSSSPDFRFNETRRSVGYQLAENLGNDSE